MPDDLDPIRARHRRYPVAMSQAMRDGRTLLALLDAAMAQEARLREALRDADEYIVGWHPAVRRDHACEECVPGGPIVVPGFLCGYHQAKARLAQPEATDA